MLKHHSQPAYYTFKGLSQMDGLIHAVFTRWGGVSNPPFATLNVSLAVGDDPAAVAENRRRVAAAMGVAVSNLVMARQVHGSEVAVIGPEYLKRPPTMTSVNGPPGPVEADPAMPSADALVTNVPGLALCLHFADCVPIILSDPEHGAVGLVHAGWRGTLEGIARRTVQTMMRAFGTRPAALWAAIGPAVGPCCYTIDDQRADLVRASFPWWPEVLVTPASGMTTEDETSPGAKGGSNSIFNLWEANRRQLEEVGLLPDRIEVAGICTACATADFYSYRAEGGRTGRFAVSVSVGKPRK